MIPIVNTDIICPNCRERHMVREEPRIIRSNAERYEYICPDCGFAHTAKSDEDMKEWIKNEEEILREQVRAFMGIVKETTGPHEMKDAKDNDRLLKESDVLNIAFQLPLVVNSAFYDAVKSVPSAYQEDEDLIRRSDAIKAFCMDCRNQDKPCEHEATCKTMRILLNKKKLPNYGARIKGGTQ